MEPGHVAGLFRVQGDSRHTVWDDALMPATPIADLLDGGRERVAAAIRSRVVGPNADQRAQELFDAPGARWFADDRPIRVVHSDASMFIGGMRALLLQSLHPLAMAGVAQHSDYRADPWGRLQRTADFLAATTFGPADQAEQAVSIVHRVHQRVVGTSRDGRPYAANDPHLLRWVHVAEVDSFITAHRRFGATPLDDAGYDGYVADMAVIATKLGAETPPTSIVELHDALREFRPELASSREARDAARYLTLTPPLPFAGRAAYGTIAAAAIGLLPIHAKAMLRLPWLPVTERAVTLPAGDAITRIIRWALPTQA